MKKNIKAIILGLVVVIGVSYASAAWNAAPSDGPANAGTNNAAAPINVSASAQIKDGSLTLGGLGVVGDFKFLPSANASITDGLVLMADGVTGKVKWGDVSSLVSAVAYDSGWLPVTAGTPMTVNHGLGTNKLIVQIFTSAVASGANPTIANSFFQNTDYNSSGQETQNVDGGIVITGITNSSISINPVSNKVATLQRSGQYLSNVAKVNYSYVKVLATKAAPGSIIGSRKVYSWNVAQTRSDLVYIDYKFGTLINKDCPPYTYKTYDYFLNANINPKNGSGNTATKILINTAPDFDFPFTCTVIVGP